MFNDYTEEEKTKLNRLKEAIADLDGVSIPFNIISRNINPLYEWLKEQ